MDINTLFSVKGKTALVTGGGRGIGRMIAEGFVRNGCTVYITSRSESACQKAAEEITQTARDGARCIALPAIDLGKGEQAESELRQALEKANVSTLNILVNNSGTTWGEPFETHPEKGWKKVFELNLFGLFFVTRVCLPLLKAGAAKGDPARIINVGSIAGITPQLIPTYGYDCSKIAVHHLTKKFANEFAMYNITVNAIAPGIVPSKMSDGLLTYTTKEDLTAQIPLQRIGEGEDMAGVALYLCSKAGSWVTGIVLPVDGGALIARL